MNILIVGAGGHGRTIADAILAAVKQGSNFRAIGFADDTPELQGTGFCGIPVLGPLEGLENFGHDGVIVGVGDNVARRRLFLQLRAAGHRMVTVIHPAAAVGADVEIGAGTYIGPNTLIGVTTRIGDNVIINGNTCIGHHNDIGDHAHVAPGAVSTGRVTLGEGAQVNVSVNLLPDSSVGEWSIIMAGAIVTGAVPSFVLAGGSRARSIQRIEGPGGAD